MRKKLLAIAFAASMTLTAAGPALAHHKEGHTANCHGQVAAEIARDAGGLAHSEFDSVKELQEAIAEFCAA